jgi:hypothetical protein
MKHPMFLVLALVLNPFAGCNGSSSDTSALETQVAALEARITTLESQLATVQSQVTTATTTLSDASAAISWAEDVQQYVSIDSRGDVVVAGANLRVQNVPGETPPSSPTLNSKGNIIVGFDDERREGTCTGGANNGLACDPDLVADCPDGTCSDPQVVSDKTGSHNVVIGPKHSYTRDSSLLVGFGNTVTASAAFAGGVRNVVAAAGGSVHGGTQNVIPTSGFGSTICGGKGNSAGGTYAVVAGGQNNSATGFYSVAGGGRDNANGADWGVIVGGHSNTSVTPYSIVP